MAVGRLSSYFLPFITWRHASIAVVSAAHLKGGHRARGPKSYGLTAFAMPGEANTYNNLHVSPHKAVEGSSLEATSPRSKVCVLCLLIPALPAQGSGSSPFLLPWRLSTPG